MESRLSKLKASLEKIVEESGVEERLQELLRERVFQIIDEHDERLAESIENELREILERHKQDFKIGGRGMNQDIKYLVIIPGLADDEVYYCYSEDELANYIETFDDEGKMRIFEVKREMQRNETVGKGG